jgi:ABC-type transporter Mla subunit MlaD
MTRRPNASVVASPVLIGAVTVLVVVVAVLLAYNANRGLPFVPSLDVKVQMNNAEVLGKGSEVKEGGFRIGFVERTRPVRLENGDTGAEVDLKLDADADLPVDTTFKVRPRSPLGLKYLEVRKGDSDELAQNGHTFPAASTSNKVVAIDRVNEQFPEPTRNAVRRNTRGFGDALAGRGVSINESISELPHLFALLEPVARNLADPQTNLGRFFRELGDAARVVRPIAVIQARLFTRSADTFEALSRNTSALKETISRTHPSLVAGTSSFRVQQPFLAESIALARETQPVTRELRPALPVINEALEDGAPVLRRSPPMWEDTKLTLIETRELVEDPATGRALRALTATSRTVKPQLRFLGPYQTVCNYWNYWWTFLGEHLSQETPFGFAQRAILRTAPRQRNAINSMGATRAANGEGYEDNPANRRNGPPVFAHGQPYGAAITHDGRADCENGQRGYPRRIHRTGENPNEFVALDPNTPGVQGPTYEGRPRVLRGQTFTRYAGGRAAQIPDVFLAPEDRRR